MATIQYCEKTKEELIEIILDLERKNNALEKEVTDLKKKTVII